MIRDLVCLVILVNLAFLLVLWAGSRINDRRSQHTTHEDVWLFDDPAFIDESTYAEMRHEDDVWFAASVMADIDDLPEVRHG